jgi:putative selenium metabolism hydrolase
MNAGTTDHADPEPKVVSLTRELVSVGGQSGDEGRVADLVQRTMAALGFRDITRDRLGNVIGYVGPKDTPVSLLFDSHMDVVAVTGVWSVDPFGAEIRDGRLYGRGATDMKGALAASLCGVAEAARSGRLTSAVAVSASVLEETIEGRALGEVLDVVNPAMTVICEPSSLSIKTGQRGRIEIIVEVSGIPAHAAHPDRGKNAITLAATALAEIAAMELAVDPVFGPMIMVPTDIKSDPYPLISALPSSVTIRFDRRIGMAETCDGVMQALRDTLHSIDPLAFAVRVSADPITTYTGVEVQWERYLAPWSQSREQPLVRAAAESLAQAGVKVSFGTYAFCTNGSECAGMRNIATIGLGPGNERDAHIIDESISIEELCSAVTVYRNLVLNIAGGKNGDQQ